jgi:hypothetical protein
VFDDQGQRSFRKALEEQAMVTPARSGTQVAAAISLNQICQAGPEGDWGTQTGAPEAAGRVESRRAWLHVLYGQHTQAVLSAAGDEGPECHRARRCMTKVLAHLARFQ